MIENLFVQVSLVIIVATLVSFIMRIIKQPLIIGYILTGIIVSPFFLGLIGHSSNIDAFAHFGIALLFFIVGLHLNPKFIKTMGASALVIGLLQVLITAAVGVGVGLLFGFSFVASVLLGLALSFSSTIIVMKFLSDKGDLETVYGRISVGVLLVQDLIVILVLMFISTISSSNLSFTSLFFDVLFKGGGFFVLLFLFSKYVLPKFETFIGRNQEFLFLFSLAWCFALAGAFEYLGFSLEIGALLAGISLSMTSLNHEISSKIKPLRDFFLILFFIVLGSQINFSHFSHLIFPAIILSLFVLLIKPIIIMSIMGKMGYTKRNSFRVGFSLSQISAFSLILISTASIFKLISSDYVSLISVVTILTITGSTYFFSYDKSIYKAISPLLRIFERKGDKRDRIKHITGKHHDIILFGANRMGFDIIETLKRLKKKFLVVDFNPETVAKLSKEGIDVEFGDLDDIEFLSEFDFRNNKMVISTVPDVDANLMLLKFVRNVNKKAIVIVVGTMVEDSLKLYKNGATYVVVPRSLGGRHVASLLENYKFNLDKFLREKSRHLNRINEVISKRKNLSFNRVKK